MNDYLADRALAAALDLAVVIRDEGPDAVRAAAQKVLNAAGGDPIAAVCVAAALIQVDQPIDRWWTGMPVHVDNHGTMRGYNRHLTTHTDPCEPCREAMREHGRARRARAGAARKPPAPCGTHAAYERHRRRGEPIDDACRAGETAYKRNLAARRNQPEDTAA